MAAADYYLCDRCDAKTFYDAEVDYADRVGDMKCICNECAKQYEVVIRARAEEGKPKTQEELFHRIAVQMVAEVTARAEEGGER
jgi:thymidine kinase